MLEQSIRDYGAGRSILADKHGTIIAGNKTLEAAAAVGLDDIVVVRTDGRKLVVVQRTDLDLAHDAAAKELAIADNRVGQVDLAWDTETLAQLQRDGADLSKFFTPIELADLLGEDEASGGTGDAEHVPDVRATSIKAGDLFALGKHRLLCGDSTRLDEAERVLDGRKADCVFTDPPYGVNVTGAGGKAIAGDISFTAIPLMFDVLDKIVAPGAWVYVCGGQSNMPLYGRMFERYFRRLPQVIVWNKGSVSVMRPNGYHSCFEFIYYGFREGGGARWFGGRTGDDADDLVTLRAPSSQERDHPTEKPVELPARAIRNSCPPGGLVFEPFSGSGSTLVAAEQEGRACCAVEIDPKYCQVTIDRWQDYTGQTAQKL